MYKIKSNRISLRKRPLNTLSEPTTVKPNENPSKIFITIPPSKPSPVSSTCPDPIGGENSLKKILLSTILEAETRIQQARILFGNVAKILDEAKANNNLTSHLVNLFRDFIVDLNIIALSHFECNVRDAPSLTPQHVKTIEITKDLKAAVPFTNSKVIPAPKSAPIYAAVIEAHPPKLQHLTLSKPFGIIAPLKSPPKKTEDYRLFVRISE